MIPDLSDWYWRADDGRVFSSRRVALVPADDAGLADWVAQGHFLVQWPRDADGAQTTASLQAVLDPYGLFASLQAYAAARRYAVETGGILVNGLAVATDRISQAMIGNAYAYVQVSGAASVSYKTGAGFVTLSADQIKVVALAVGAHVQACFKAEDDADAALGATPPTITTLAQVDAVFAPLMPTPR